MNPRAPTDLPQHDPATYFTSFGWKATCHMTDADERAWMVSDASGEEAAFCSRGPVSDDVLWYCWKSIAEDLVSNEVAARHAVDLVDRGAFGEPLSWPFDLPSLRDPKNLLQDVSNISNVLLTPLGEDWLSDMAA